MMTDTTTPRIYVASLSDYNAGRLHGRWIDATDDIGAEVHEMLAESPEPGAEEWAIHDYEGFGPIRLSEWESFETVAALATAIEEHGDAFAVFYENESRDSVADALESFEESYGGHWDSVEDYARELFDDTAPSVEAREMVDSQWPFTCIDWEHAARELTLGGDIWVHELDSSPWGVYVFRNY